MEVIEQLYGDDSRYDVNNATTVYVRNGKVVGMVNRGYSENIGWGIGEGYEYAKGMGVGASISRGTVEGQTRVEGV